MKRLCVFCGSNMGARPAYEQGAKALGEALVKHQIELVYGGGKVGLMGVVADAVLTAGGRVIGVIPQALVEKEVGHAGLTELHVVQSMHERKALMADLSDGFIAMPGGFGTFEEFCEVVTWTQLGFHEKPCGLFNIDRFYDPLIVMFDHATTEQFIRPVHRSIVLTATDPDQLITLLANYQHQTVQKWTSEKQLGR